MTAWRQSSGTARSSGAGFQSQGAPPIWSGQPQVIPGETPANLLTDPLEQLEHPRKRVDKLVRDVVSVLIESVEPFVGVDHFVGERIGPACPVRRTVHDQSPIVVVAADILTDTAQIVRRVDDSQPRRVSVVIANRSMHNLPCPIDPAVSGVPCPRLYLDLDAELCRADLTAAHQEHGKESSH